jgi:hypothetical protein
MEPDESPETVHRVALYVGAMVECQNWLKRSLELKRAGELQSSETATAKARMFFEFMTVIHTEADLRVIDVAASRLVRHTLPIPRANKGHRS